MCVCIKVVVIVAREPYLKEHLYFSYFNICARFTFIIHLYLAFDLDDFMVVLHVYVLCLCEWEVY